MPWKSLESCSWNYGIHRYHPPPLTTRQTEMENLWVFGQKPKKCQKTKSCRNRPKIGMHDPQGSIETCSEAEAKISRADMLFSSFRARRFPFTFFSFSCAAFSLHRANWFSFWKWCVLFLCSSRYLFSLSIFVSKWWLALSSHASLFSSISCSRRAVRGKASKWACSSALCFSKALLSPMVLGLFRLG